MRPARAPDPPRPDIIFLCSYVDIGSYRMCRVRRRKRSRRQLLMDGRRFGWWGNRSPRRKMKDDAGDEESTAVGWRLFRRRPFGFKMMGKKDLELSDSANAVETPTEPGSCIL
jgi:hypothetical protein